MIQLTKLTNEKYYMNPNLIEIIELTPDTLITMTTGKKYYALESIDEIMERVEEYYKKTGITVRRFVNEKSKS